MRIAYRHRQAAVPQDFLEHQNVSAIHDEMAGKGVAQAQIEEIDAVFMMFMMIAHIEF